MTTLLTWPPDPPEALADLYAMVEGELGPLRLRSLPGASAPEAPDGEGVDEQVLLVLAPNDDRAAVLDAVERFTDRADRDLVLVIGDGYLGTDAVDAGSAAVGAASVALARSMAVRQGGTRRANVVVVPDAVLGIESTQRGPLPTAVGVTDIANAIAFLLGASGRYLNGQVLFVNGGRQLFSSLTA